MPRYVYSVLRFVPNPASGEFVNIGAIAGSDELRDWSVRVVSSHKRAKKLDERGVIAHVFEHVQTVEDLCALDDDGDEGEGEHAPAMSEPALWRLFGEWQSIVQLSEPTPIAADSAESALEAVFTQQILDPGKQERQYRTKLQARLAMHRKPLPVPTPLPAHLKARLRARSMCAEQTIDRWWNDRTRVRDATDQRLTQAAHEEGIAHPSEAGETGANVPTTTRRE
jgi:hypothetical protein